MKKYFAILLLLILVTLLYIYSDNLTISGEYGYEASEANNVWFIFTKIKAGSRGETKFEHCLFTLISYTSIEFRLNLISDDKSYQVAKSVVDKVANVTSKQIQVVHYDIVEATGSIADIITTMKQHFSSKAGSYYSDSLFYISLGLHRIAPATMTRAVLLDIDLQFHADIALLFKEFDNFRESELFGLAPELSPVYYHLLSTFRSKHADTDLGLPCAAKLPTLQHSGIEEGKGRPGLNSGVVLLRLDRISRSKLYQTVTSKEFVSSLTDKYYFKGHLGDQDWYSLMSWELPSIVHQLNCAWNRQLCTWWASHGYHATFKYFNHCPNRTLVYHANCNSDLP